MSSGTGHTVVLSCEWTVLLSNLDLSNKEYLGKKCFIVFFFHLLNKEAKYFYRRPLSDVDNNTLHQRLVHNPSETQRIHSDDRKVMSEQQERVPIVKIQLSKGCKYLQLQIHLLMNPIIWTVLSYSVFVTLQVKETCSYSEKHHPFFCLFLLQLRGDNSEEYHHKFQKWKANW